MFIKERDIDNFTDFNSQIINRIKNVYINLKPHVEDNLIDIKNFTVVLLLKLKHLYYILNTYQSLKDTKVDPTFSLWNQQNLTIRIYYRLSDLLMLIPMKCQESANPKFCSDAWISADLRLMSNFFHLQRSMNGWNILDYLKNLLHKVFDNISDTYLDNFKNFQEYYFQSIYVIMRKFKKRYGIKGSKSLRRLDNMLINTINEFKSRNIQDSSMNFSLLDQLSMDLYNTNMDLIAQYDEFGPIEDDEHLLTKIQNKMFNFFLTFETNFNSKINKDFYRLMGSLRAVVSLWKQMLINDHNDRHFVVHTPLRTEYLYKYIKPNEPNHYSQINVTNVLHDQNQQISNLIAHKGMVDEVKNPDNYFKLKMSRNSNQVEPLGFLKKVGQYRINKQGKIDEYEEIDNEKINKNNNNDDKEEKENKGKNENLIKGPTDSNKDRLSSSEANKELLVSSEEVIEKNENEYQISEAEKQDQQLEYDQDQLAPNQESVEEVVLAPNEQKSEAENENQDQNPQTEQQKPVGSLFGQLRDIMKGSDFQKPLKKFLNPFNLKNQENKMI